MNHPSLSLPPSLPPSLISTPLSLHPLPSPLPPTPSPPFAPTLPLPLPFLPTPSSLPSLSRHTSGGLGHAYCSSSQPILENVFIMLMQLKTVKIQTAMNLSWVVITKLKSMKTPGNQAESVDSLRPKVIIFSVLNLKWPHRDSKLDF